VIWAPFRAKVQPRLPRAGSPIPNRPFPRPFPPSIYASPSSCAGVLLKPLLTLLRSTGGTYSYLEGLLEHEGEALASGGRVVEVEVGRPLRQGERRVGPKPLLGGDREAPPTPPTARGRPAGGRSGR
jgi:hypothetical protein